MWLKLDAAFPGHPKVIAAGRDARDVYHAGLCWSAAYVTDGYLPVSCLGRLAADAACGDAGTIDTAAVVRRLLEVGLWEKAPGGFQIHDYLKHQTSRATLRGTARKRAQAGALGGAAERQHPASSIEAHAKQNASKTQANDEANAEHMSSNGPATDPAKQGVDIDIESDYLNPPAPHPPAADDVATTSREARAPDLGPASLRAVPKPHELDRVAVEGHRLYDPLVALFGRPPTRDLAEWRADLAALDDLGAMPDDIPRAAVAYAALMGTDATGRPILLTRPALVRHWPRCVTAAPPSRLPVNGRAPIDGQLDPTDYTAGKYARFFNRPVDDDGDDARQAAPHD